MRVRVLIVALAACAALSLWAEGDLASSLIAAKNAEERLSLLNGRNPVELTEALRKIEKAADGSYTSKQYAAGLNAYEAAVTLAREAGSTAKLPFYFRRLGLCHSLLAQNEAALASYREGIASAEKLDDAEMLAENLHGAANILQRVGRYREALPLSKRESELTEKLGNPDLQLRALTTYSQSMSGLGHEREALALAERALELSHRSSHREDYSLCLGNLALAYGRLGDWETTLRLTRTIPSPNANDLNAIGISEVRLHREGDAEVDYRASIAASSDPAMWRVHAGALLNLGILEHRHGKLAEARGHVEQSLAVSLAHQDQRGATTDLAELSQIAADEKKPAEALKQAEEALRLGRESESPEGIVNALVAQAHALDVSGRGEEAGRTYTEAVSVAEGMRADTPASAAGLQGELDQWMPTYQYAVDHQLREGNALAALQLADRAKARVLLDMIEGGGPGFDALADPEERAEAQRVRDEVSRVRRAAIAKPGAALQAALEGALRKEEDFNVRLYGRHPELVLQRAAPPDIRPEDLAALIPDSRTALLSYFISQYSVALFVVRCDRPDNPTVKVFTLSGKKLDGLIRSFRSQIASRDLDYRVTARALFDALVAPAASSLRGTDRWILSPDGALWDVPFQALMDVQGKHVLETRSLSYAPSLSVLREVREKAATPEPPSVSLLVVANPSVTGVAPIPETAREASAITALYGGSTTLLTGDRATTRLFREHAAGASMIHIASHAETETNHPLESFLLFSPDKTSGGSDSGQDDGAFTARDLLGMRLHANLVVLSACETARGKIGQGDGVMGLGWAVLAAGARASVLSQWKVDSSATSDLMIDFHRRLTGGKGVAKARDKAEALRLASLDILHSPGRLHPFYWAAFIVVGDSR